MASHVRRSSQPRVGSTWSAVNPARSGVLTCEPRSLVHYAGLGTYKFGGYAGSSQRTVRMALTDEEFRAAYELALLDLPPDDLDQIAHLSNARVREFVLAPAALRPHLLKKWRDEKPPLQRLREGIKQINDERKTKREAEAAARRAEWARKPWWRKLLRF